VKDKWPTDFSMQVYEIKQQVEGYQFCREFTDRRVPADVFAAIKSNAAAKWSNDFSMQKYEIQQQVKAYLLLNK